MVKILRMVPGMEEQSVWRLNYVQVSPLGLTDAIKNGTALTLAPMQEIQNQLYGYRI